MTNPVTIEAPEGVPFITFAREFDAPVAAVFRAHAEPDLVTQWLGPNGYEMRIAEWDFTTHGGYRYTHRDPRRQRVRLPRHLPQRARERVRRADLRVRGRARPRRDRDDDVRRPRRRAHEARRPLDVPERRGARDAMVASGMDRGLTEGYERLDALVA